MKNFLYITFLVISFFSLPNLLAQEPDLDNRQLLELLTENKNGDGPGDSDDITGRSFSADGYKSFVQNELNSVYKQLEETRPEDMEEITRATLNKARVNLATQLCEKDVRACFLVDNYREYKDFIPEATSASDLKLFGQDIFSGYSNEFNFYDSLPVSDDYIINIGDQLNIYLFGGLNSNETYIVDVKGSILIEGLGSFVLSGMSVSGASKLIKDLLDKQYLGTEVIISLKQIRSKQIYILGNIRSPGTFTLNAFSTPLNALISAGGILKNSSLREVTLLRNGIEYSKVDFYDFLIRGDSSKLDTVLQEGDTMLVGGLTNSVSIYGEVNRPAVYEFKEGETLEDIISFSLGFSPFADKRSIAITRTLASGQKTILNPANLANFEIKNGDVIKVNASNGQIVNYVSLNGALRNPRDFPYSQGMVLGDLIKLDSDLLQNTYTGFAVIKRLNFASKSFRLLTFTLTDQSALNKFNIFSGDQVYIFSKEDIQYSQSMEVYNYLANPLPGFVNQSEENNFLYKNLISADGKPLIDSRNISSVTSRSINSCLVALDVLTKKPISNLIEAKLELFPSNNKKVGCTPLFQTNSELLPILLINAVPVVGNVRFPGLYPTARDLSALDLFNFAGGFLLSKLNTEPVFDVGIRSRGFGSFGFNELRTLTNITMLNLKIDEGSSLASYVELVGEFKNPGVYAVTKNTSLGELYERAGGLTENAYPLGGIFTRKSIQKIETDALKRSKAELSEIMASAVASGYVQQSATDLVGLISLMSSLENANPIGRLVTELNPVKIQNNIEDNIILENGDKIYIPTIQTTVTIVGQVLNPVTVPHIVGATFDDYLKLAGGIKKEADKNKIYALLPNGEAIQRKGGVLFSSLPYLSFNREDILPGSTLVIPRKARPLDSLALVETITPVLANLSVTAASIAAISDN